MLGFDLQENLVCEGCGASSCGLLTEAAGTLSIGPEYSAGGNCVWMIAAEPGSWIILTLSRFDTQTLAILSVLECYNINCSSVKPLASLRGNLSSYPIIKSTSNYMLLHFAGEWEEADHAGFTAQWISRPLVCLLHC